MSNVFDYLKWRDDLKLDEINEIDALIFSRLVYLPLENIVKEKMTIEEILKLSKELEYAREEDKLLLEAIGKSDRYKNLYISNFVSKMNYDLEEQFAAMTVHLKNSVFVAYRGTTSDIIGWKEDFNMSYMTVPAQIDALDYLKKVKSRRIYIGGHSKGGALAIYAAVNYKFKNKIIKVFNFDGPGLVNLDKNYYNIKNKITSYIPDTSIVGRLFNLDNETIVMKSNEFGIKQHNVYSWMVEKNYFVKDKLSKESDVIKNIIDEWLNKTSVNNRKEFVNTVYQILLASGAKKIKDINLIDLKDMLVKYKDIDEQSKTLLINLINMLFDSTKKNIDRSIHESIKH